LERENFVRLPARIDNRVVALKFQAYLAVACGITLVEISVQVFKYGVPGTDEAA
jgi:hypothetical protein